jgi:hypothetical protein
MDQHRRAHRQSIRDALNAMALAVTCCAAAGARAEDLVINVPVELEAMEPEVHSVQVSCYVHGEVDGVRMGYGDASAPMPEDGDFHGVVRVPIVLLPGKDSRDARGYVCSLMFPGGTTMAQERDRGTPGAQPSPGTTPVLQIRGVFPTAR